MAWKPPFPWTPQVSGQSPLADQSFQNGDRPAGGSFTLWNEYTFDTLTAGAVANDGGTDGFQNSENGNGNTTVVSNTRSVSGANSAQATIIGSGQEPWGADDQFIYGPDGGTGTMNSGDEIWIQWQVWHPLNYDNDTTGDGGTKFFRMRFENAGEVPLVTTTWQLRGASTVTGFRTEIEGSFLDDVDVTQAPWNWALGQWNKYEHYIRLGTTDGIVRTWINDQLVTEGLNQNTIGSAVFNRVRFQYLNFWNNSSPQTQSVWIDNVKHAWSVIDLPTNTDASGNRYIG